MTTTGGANIEMMSTGSNIVSNMHTHYVHNTSATKPNVQNDTILIDNLASGMVR